MPHCAYILKIYESTYHWYFFNALKLQYIAMGLFILKGYIQGKNFEKYFKPYSQNSTILVFLALNREGLGSRKKLTSQNKEIK